MPDYKLKIDLRESISPLADINDTIAFFLRAVGKDVNEADLITEDKFVGDYIFSSHLELNQVREHGERYLSLMKICDVKYELTKTTKSELTDRTINLN